MDENQRVISASSDHPPFSEWDVIEPIKKSQFRPPEPMQQKDSQVLDYVGFCDPIYIYLENLGGLTENPIRSFRIGSVENPCTAKIRVSNPITELGNYPLHSSWIDIKYQANEGGHKIPEFTIKEGCIFDRPLVMELEYLLPVNSRTRVHPAHQYSILVVQSLHHASKELRDMYEKRVEKPNFVPVELPKRVEPFSYARLQLEQAL
jgi:hypothetical protein